MEPLFEKLKKEGIANPQRLVLPESTEERNMIAADRMLAEGTGKITLIGKKDEIIAKANEMNLPNICKATFVDNENSEETEKYAQLFYELRKSKGITIEDARAKAKNPLYLGCLLVKAGEADGMVSGAIHATSDVLRPAFQVLKTAPGVNSVSGAFIIVLPEEIAKKYGEKGMLVFDGKEVFCPKPMVSGALAEKAHHTMRAAPVAARDFACGRKSVIGLIPGTLISENAGTAQGIDLSADILKIALVERHRATGHIGLGYLKGYGLKTGAVASSIAHDSHNIIAVGTSDETLAIAVNAVIDQQGGIAVVDASGVLAALPLPIAGLMSDESLETVNTLLAAAKAAALHLGVPAQIDPFMTLSFMSLPVIPDLKLTTRGVFDVKRWRFADES